MTLSHLSQKPERRTNHDHADLHVVTQVVETGPPAAFLRSGPESMQACTSLGPDEPRLQGEERSSSLADPDELRGVRQTKTVDFGSETHSLWVANSEPIKEHYPALAGGIRGGKPSTSESGSRGNICHNSDAGITVENFIAYEKAEASASLRMGKAIAPHCIFGSGHVCYIVDPSDTAPALMAHEASVRIAGPKGTQLVPLGILCSRKVRARNSWDFALAGVAFALQFKADRIEKARVVLSGAAPIPWRSKPVEDAIVAKRLNAGTVERASEAVVKDADPLEHNAYKIPLFQGLIEEELANCKKFRDLKGFMK